MKKHTNLAAFTLLEVMTVLAVIVILVAMVVGVSGMVTKKSAVARAKTEIAMLSVAADNYKNDVGSYPNTENTQELNPMEHFKSSGEKYQKASLDFYGELTGDKTEPYDGKPDAGAQAYLKEFDQRILRKSTLGTGSEKKISVSGFQDPFGNYYGYSTAAAEVERKFLKALKSGSESESSRKKGVDAKGFNAASFDLWSTGGGVPPEGDATDKTRSLEHAKWIKNW